MQLDAFHLRPARPADLPALYHVCLKTGDSGKDASHLQDDPTLLGQVFVGPYVMLEAELAFTLEGPMGPVGYVLGARDTVSFNRNLGREWYPALRKDIHDPGADATQWQGSDWVRRIVHHPFLDFPQVLEPYPSHAHIDLLAEARGKGVGARMMRHMMGLLAALESPGLHLQVSPKNLDAQTFYRKLGFATLVSRELPDDTLFMVRSLP